MSLPIKVLLVFLITTSISFSQEVEKETVLRSDTISANMRNFRPRLLTLSVDGYVPISSGDKYIGKSMEGNFGFSLKAQMMIYKQFFIKLGFGASYFKVNDISSTGNYRSTSIANQYISVGYEFLPIKKVRLGLSLSVFGNADYSNKFSEGISVIQKDTARLNIYELYIDYEVFYFMAVTVNYAYRNDKTDIDVPSELKSIFDRAQFHTVGLGVKFYFGDNNLFHE